MQLWIEHGDGDRVTVFRGDNNAQVWDEPDGLIAVFEGTGERPMPTQSVKINKTANSDTGSELGSMGAARNQLEVRTDHAVDEPDEGVQDVSIDEANRSGATVYPRGRR